MKKNESGRSMVEMLGVLAIIGVLSVGGIAGENAISIELTFDSPSVCRAAATSLGIKPDSTSTVNVTDKDTGEVTRETVTAGCSSNKKLTYVFTQS